MHRLPSILAALTVLLLPGAALADDAGICGLWRGTVRAVNDAPDGLWQERFAIGDLAQGYFMKRGVPSRITTTSANYGLIAHGTNENFDDHAQFAMNVNINGYVLENDSRAAFPPTPRTRVLRQDFEAHPQVRVEDLISFYTDFLKVSDELEYRQNYSLLALFKGEHDMIQTAPGLSAGLADLNPSRVPRNVAGTFVDSYGFVNFTSWDGTGSAAVILSIDDYQTIPCERVSFDAETGMYGLVGGGD